MGAGAMLYDVWQHRQINKTTQRRTDTIKDTQTEIWTLWPQRQVGDEKLKIPQSGICPAPFMLRQCTVIFA